MAGVNVGAGVSSKPRYEGPFAPLRKLDDVVFSAEQAIVAIFLSAMTVMVFLDVVYRRLVAPDSKIGAILAGIFGVDDPEGRARLDANSVVPDYVFGVTLDDSTVTNASNYALARALDIPHVADEVRPVLGLTRATEVPPLTGNGPGGATVGLLQFDVIDNDDPATEATHDNMPTSDVGRELIESFLASHFEDGAATLSDPYVQLGLSHAPPTP